jgi:hypothetical protein
MATAIQRRRGTSAQHSSFTGLAGEITIDTTNNTVIVHDGSTAGGHRLAKYSEITALGEGDITGIVAGAGLTGDATSGDATLAVGAGYGITVNANDIELTNSSVRALFSASGDLSYDSGTGAFSFTNDAGDIEGVTAGDGLSGGGTSGTVSLALDLNELTAATVDVSADSIAIIDGGDNSSKKESIADLASAMAGTGITATNGVLSATTGDIEGVTAGTGLSGGGTSGTVTVNIDHTATWDGNLIPGANATYDLGSSSAVWNDLYLAGSTINLGGTTISVSGGQLQFGGSNVSVAGDATTNTTTRSLFSAGGDLSYNSGSGQFSFTERTDAEVRGLVSATDAGGDGSFAYNSSTGAFTYTGPSASEVRAHFSAGTGIAISSGEISTNDGAIDIHSLSGYVANEHIDHSSVTLTAGDGLSGGGDITASRSFAVDSSVVRTTGTQTVNGDKTFGNDIIISGNLTVNGTQTTVSTETLAIEDNIIVLNNGTSGTPSENAGIQVDRGSSDDVFLNWDESNDKWQFTNDGSTYYNMLTESDVEGFFSVSDAGGDGSLTYSAGVFTYTGPSASEVRAHFSGGTGIAISSGSVSVDLSELTDMTAAVDGAADELILLDAGADRRKLISEINLGQFNNDQGWTSNVGDITGVTAGTGLSGGGSSGSVTLNVTGLTVSELAAGSLQISSESFSDNDTSLMTSAAINDRIESFGYTTNVGDITGVTAGNGLTGGGASGSVTLNAVGGYGITVNANDIELANSDVRGLFSGGTGITYDDSTGAISLTDTGYVTGVTAGTGLTGGGTSGTVTLNVDTGAVTNGATTIPTGDQVYDFVTGLGYSTTTGTVTSVGVTAGTGLSGGGTVTTSGTISLALDMSELTDMTAAMTSSDEFIVLDAGADRRKAASEIGLSIFNNDSGFTTNVGDITAVTAGSYLTGGGTSGGVTLNVDATSANTASKVVARDGSGNFSAGTITATATQAQYADLAEKYSADEDYEPGTVVVFGGDAEVTACEEDADHRVAGVVSTDPAYLMNSDADGVAIALKGRVPCKVTGQIEKGALIVTSSIKGHGMQANQTMPGTIIGKAIESKSDDGEGIIEILVV